MPSLPKAITFNGFIGFALIAMLVAMFGPSFPSLQAHFGVNETQVGFSLTAHFIGTFIGTMSAAALQRIELRSRLLFCSSIFVLGSFIIAFAPTWFIFLAGTAFRSIGAGLYFTDINALFASGFGKRSASMLGLVNAAYGAGSFLGPILVGYFSGDYRTPFILGSFLSLIMLLLAFISPNVETKSQTQSKNFVAPYGLIALFMLMLFCSGSIENGLGAWMTRHFVDQGLSLQTAANYTGMYWAAETIGRVLMTPLALRLSPFQLLVAGFSLEAILLALADVSGFIVPAYVLAGVSVAPLFTSGLVWMASTMPGFRMATTLGLLGSLVGAASMSPVLGQLIERFSSQILPSSLLGVTLLGLGLSIAIYLVTRPKRIWVEK
jgi:MFS transporter, FHS family, glucose/mannose:H+ symporter